MDEASIANGELFGGQMCPVSALAEYVMNAVNPVLPPGYKVTWDHVITHTPWMKKQLFNFTSEEEWKMHRQAIPVVGISSDLKVAMEMCYNQHIMDMAAQQKKKEQQEKPGPKAAPSSKPTRIKNMGHGETIKLHLWKKAPGQDWPRRLADVEMEDATSGFEHKVSHLGYDVNLVRHSGDTMLGSTSPVTAQENQLLDEDTGLTRAPGTGRLGTEENPS